MALSQTETILAGFHQALADGVTAPVLRNAVLPTRIPASGLMILRDGDPGEPEVVLSPLSYTFERVLDLEVYVQAASDLDAAADAIFRQIGAVIRADRTLSGACDWIEAQAPQTEALPVEGGHTIKASVVPILLTYTVTDPLI